MWTGPFGFLWSMIKASIKLKTADLAQDGWKLLMVTLSKTSFIGEFWKISSSFFEYLHTFWFYKIHQAHIVLYLTCSLPFLFNSFLFTPTVVKSISLHVILCMIVHVINKILNAWHLHQMKYDYFISYAIRFWCSKSWSQHLTN